MKSFFYRNLLGFKLYNSGHMELVKLELKKILQKNNLYLGILFMLVCLTKMYPIASSLDIVVGDKCFDSGITSWNTLKIEGQKYDGFLSKEHMLKVRSLYQECQEKPYLENTNSIEKDLGLRLIFPFQWLANSLNYPYEEDGVQNFTINLTNQEINNFYINRLSTFKRRLIMSDYGYRSDQVKALLDQASQVKTPFYYAYNEGWRYLGDYLYLTFHLFLVYLTLVFVPLVSKDSLEGIDDIALYTKKGRYDLYLAKVRAGEIYGSCAFMVYLLILLIFVSCIFSLHGGDANMEFYYSLSIFNLTTAQAFFLELLSGYFAMLAMVNIFFLMGILLNKKNLTTVLLIVILFWINKRSQSMALWSQILAYLTPQNFIFRNFSLGKLIIIRGQVFPFTLLAGVLTLIYVVLSRLMASYLMNKYYL